MTFYGNVFTDVVMWTSLVYYGLRISFDHTNITQSAPDANQCNILVRGGSLNVQDCVFDGCPLSASDLAYVNIDHSTFKGIHQSANNRYIFSSLSLSSLSLSLSLSLSHIYVC